jgi:hypothetical protein
MREASASGEASLRYTTLRMNFDVPECPVDATDVVRERIMLAGRPRRSIEVIVLALEGAK